MNKETRPKELRYAFNDKPPFVALILLACQQLIPLGVSLIFTTIVLEQIQVESDIAASVVSIVMIASAVTTLIQAQRWRWMIGSGTFLPLSAAPNLLAQSILAIKMGGLPLLFGMTLFAGIMQAIFSFAIDFISKCFPPEIAAMVIVLIGLDLGVLGINSFISFDHTFAYAHPGESRTFIFYLVEFLPLALMIMFNCWGNSFFKMYSLFIAAIIGYVLIAATGFMDPQAIQAIHAASWVFFPTIAIGNGYYQFETTLIVPFLIGALVNTIKICGSLAGLQELQDANFKQPDMKQISRANFTDAIGTIISGISGSMGTNTSSTAISISMSTGITSRFIAYPFSLIVFIIAFCPKISLLFVYMPKPLCGAILFCLGAALLGNGCKMMFYYIRNFKQQICIGVSFVFGLSRDAYPDIFIQLPDYIKSLTGSAIIVATISAVILNFIFNVKFKKKMVAVEKTLST